MFSFSEEEVNEALSELETEEGAVQLSIGDYTNLEEVTTKQYREIAQGSDDIDHQPQLAPTKFEPQEEGQQQFNHAVNNNSQEEVNCPRISSVAVGFNCESLVLDSASIPDTQELDTSQVTSKIIVNPGNDEPNPTELVTVDIITNGIPGELNAVDKLSNIEKKRQVSYSFLTHTANTKGEVSSIDLGIKFSQLILPVNVLIIRHPALKFSREITKRICRFPVKGDTFTTFTTVEIARVGDEFVFNVEVGQKDIEESFAVSESQISNESLIMDRKLEHSRCSSRIGRKRVYREIYQQPELPCINSDGQQYISDPTRVVYKIAPLQLTEIISSGSTQDHQIPRSLNLPQIANSKKPKNAVFQPVKPQNLQSPESNGFGREIYNNQQSLPHLTPPLAVEQSDQYFVTPPQGVQQQTTSTQNDLPQLPTEGTFHPKQEDTLPPPDRERYSPGKLIVCKHCGTTSADMHYCDRCKKRLPDEAKIIIDKNGTLPAKPPGQSTSSKATSQTPHSSQESLLLFKFESIGVCQTDIWCLRNKYFLNDSILDFWIRYIRSELISSVDQERSYIFSTFFYKTLTTRKKRPSGFELDPEATASEKRHYRVNRWTKDIDIFSKDFLFFPINENLHWFLAVVCFPGLMGIHDIETGEPISNYHKPTRENDSSSKAENNHVPTTPSKSQERPKIKRPCILVLDSLFSENRSRVYATLREYLKIEYKIKKGIDGVFNKASMPGHMLKVPQQHNGWDCGLYLLYYLEKFFLSPISSFDIPIQGGRRIWPDDSEIAFKREKIYNTIIEITKKFNPVVLPFIPRLNFAKPSKIIKNISEQKQQIESAPVQKLNEVSPKEEPMDVDEQNAILGQENCEMQLELSATISTAQNSKSSGHESADGKSSGINI